MVRQIGMGYGIWESLAHLAGNRLGGHEKVWVTGVYGLSQVWIKTEATVVTGRKQTILGHQVRYLIQEPEPAVSGALEADWMS